MLDRLVLARSARHALLLCVLAGFCTTGIISCASLRNAGSTRELLLERSWVRSTLNEEFLKYRRAHRMTPVFHESLVIQGNAIDGVVAYNRETASEVWRLDIENGVEGGVQISDGQVFFGASDGLFYSVNALNGRVNWTFPVRAETLSPPTVEGGVVYFQSGTDIVYALEANSGKQKWLYNRQTTTNLSIRSSTRPAVDGDLVYVGFSDGFIVALSRQSGAMQWDKKLTRNTRFMDVDATPVIDGSSLYISSYDGSLFALNKASGQILWQFDEGGYTPVTLAKDTLYYSSTTGSVTALEKATGRKIWSSTVQQGIATRPVIFESFLLYGESEGALVVADARTGSILTRFAPGRGLLAAPAVSEVDRLIYFISNNANLYAMKLGYQKRAALLPWQQSQTL